MYNPMNVLTEEQFSAQKASCNKWIKENWPEQLQKSTTESDNAKQLQREELRKNFPFSAIVEGVYPEIDNAALWCWEHFGDKDGKCQWEHTSEYPGCPLVRATCFIEEGKYPDKEGKMHDWSEKRYKQVEVHEHVGVWTELFLGKTGYDYGNAEFYFKNEADRDAFVSAVPNIGLGENYK